VCSSDLAHHITGRVVRLAEERRCRLQDLSLAELQTVEPRISAVALELLSTSSAIERRTSYGGTAPDQVRRQVAAARERFL